MFTVLVIACFILIVPQNIHNTISARSFMAYMGVGESDLSIYFSQTETEDVAKTAAQIETALAGDEAIEKYTVLSGKVFSSPAEDGRVERLRVDLGDHTAFPVMYSEGAAPVSDNEIALSLLNAEALGKALGDALPLIVDGEERHLTVCGIYSDITAAGKTAKATFEAQNADLLRIVIPVTLADRAQAGQTVARLGEEFSFATVALSDEYVRQTFGSTLSAIQAAACASNAAAVFLSILVTLLFMKMLVAKDRYPIAAMKSMGFTTGDIRGQYLARAILVAALGVATGVILANTLGEAVGGLLISSLGATSFHFVVNPWFAYLFSPLLIAACVLCATLLGVLDIRRLKISNYIKEA